MLQSVTDGKKTFLSEALKKRTFIDFYFVNLFNKFYIKLEDNFNFVCFKVIFGNL